MRRRSLLVAKVVLVAVVAAVAILYAADDLIVRYRLAHRRANDPLEEVRTYYAARLKNGKVEIFYDAPQIEACVHSVFPHFGYRPCWYVRRATVKMM